MNSKSFRVLILTLTIILFSSAGYANVTSHGDDFLKLFNEWTLAFNNKKYPAVCELFSKSITADYQDSPRKNYEAMCNGFKKIFQEKDMMYHNHFKIHQIYRSKNLAAVRITWYLDIYKKGVHVSSIQEEGLDILHKQTNNKWQIINFIAYPQKHIS